MRVDIFHPLRIANPAPNQVKLLSSDENLAIQNSSTSSGSEAKQHTVYIKYVSKVLGKISKPAAPTLQVDLSQDL